VKPVEVGLRFAGGDTAVLSAFGHELRPEPVIVAAPETTDIKAAQFYGAILESDTPAGCGVAALLTSLLSASNVVTHLLPRLVSESVLERWTVLKWRLVVLFHVVSSLRYIAATEAKGALRPDVANALVELRRRVKFARTFKKLRDALVHYGIEDTTSAEAANFFPLERLANRPFKQVLAETERALKDVSAILSELIRLER
jgi:hypothetical protein